MRLEYKIDPKRRLLRTSAGGGFHLFAFANYLDRLFHDPLFHSKLNAMIVVLDEQTMPGVKTRAAIGKLLTVWVERRKGACWGIVLPNEACRLKAEEAIEELKINSVTVRCFTEEQKALAWFDEQERGLEGGAKEATQIRGEL